MKYFEKCTDYNDVKKLYRKLAKKHHPDSGGDPAIFKAINEEYEKIDENSFLKKQHSQNSQYNYTDNPNWQQQRYDQPFTGFTGWSQYSSQQQPRYGFQYINPNEQDYFNAKYEQAKKAWDFKDKIRDKETDELKAQIEQMKSIIASLELKNSMKDQTIKGLFETNVELHKKINTLNESLQSAYDQTNEAQCLYINSQLQLPKTLWAWVKWRYKIYKDKIEMTKK